MLRLNSISSGWPLFGSSMVMVDFCGPYSRRRPSRSSPQLRVGGRAIGRCLAARHDEIQRALCVERRLWPDGLLRVGHAIQNHRMDRLRDSAACRVRRPACRTRRRTRSIGVQTQCLAHRREIGHGRAGGVEAHPRRHTCAGRRGSPAAAPVCDPSGACQSFGISRRTAARIVRCRVDRPARCRDCG